MADRAYVGAAAGQALLEARGLAVSYGASPALDGVDFRIARGETVALLGRNGMGKSTLIRALLGLVPLRRGELELGGRSIAGLAPHRIARMGAGYVPEGRAIFASLTVRENLLLAQRPGPDGRSDWTLERVLAVFPRLAERLSHGGAQLSGGEQQMLAVGRALMTNPRLLFLDEATEGLAPLVAAEIWNILRAIRADGIASVIVDKNYRAAAAHADRALVLVKGRVVFEGPAQRLEAEPELVRRHLGV